LELAMDQVSASTSSYSEVSLSPALDKVGESISEEGRRRP
jgi:hypothetical protein